MPSIHSSLDQQLERLGQAIEKKASGKVVQLAAWPEATRAAPNVLLRSALFAAIHAKSAKRFFSREVLDIPAMKGVSIKYTGGQLIQSDLDVWEQCLHLAREHPLGNQCNFTARAFLKSLGRHTGQSQYKWLDATISRLNATALEISIENVSYEGSLIEERARNADNRLYTIRINKKIAILFNEGYTLIDWGQRMALKNKPLAQWLHSYYATHAQPHPVKVESLKIWSGSTTKELRFFRANLKKAFIDLEAIRAINTWEIDKKDLVHVTHTPSLSQKKHLAHRRQK